MIKLCYKEYPYKLTLGACREFYEQTGKDATYILMRYLEAFYIDTKGMPLISRIRYLKGLESEDTISKLLHSMIRAEVKTMPLDEIQDAMFKVSWLPNENDNDISEPWPIVVAKLAIDINDTFMDVSKKKADTRD